MKHFYCIISTVALVALTGCSNVPAGSSANAAAIDSASVKTAPQPISQEDPVKIGKTKLDTLMYAVFLALKNKSSDDYMKLAATTDEIEQLYLSWAPADKREMVKQKLKEENVGKEERGMILDAFQKTVKRGDELKINWSALVYQGVKTDSVITEGRKTYTGELTFSEGARTFHMKYDDCIRIGNKYVVTNIYTPYEDMANQNADKCSKYKAAYIRSCVRMMKKYPNETVGSKLSPEKYCSCSYEQLAKETSCEDLLKDTVSLQVRVGNCPQ